MSVNSKMTALADEIRELSGTSEVMGLDAMVEHIGEANADISTQANLIAQIASALEGKAAGGGSGGSVETCTLTIFGDAPVDPDPDSKLWYTDGSSAVKSIALPDFGDSISVTVSKNSIVVSTNGGAAGTNATKFIFNNGAVAGFFISDDANIIIM